MMKTMSQPACSFRAPLRVQRLGAGAPPAGLGRAALPHHLLRQRRSVSAAASSLDQLSGAVSSVAPELQTLAGELVSRAESFDNAAAQFVLHQPLLTIPIAALFVAVGPKVIQVTSKRVGVPLVAAMVAWLVLTHPTALIHTLGEVEAAIESQPVACSLAIFTLAVLLVAPYVTVGAGTAATAYLVASVVQQEGWTPEQLAPAAVPLRTIQTKWEVAATEAQLRGVTAPPSIPAPDLSAISPPNIKLPDLPNIPVPSLPAAPVPSWALNAIPSVPELPTIRSVNLDLTAVKETLPTLSLPVTLQDMPWASQGFIKPWEKGFTLPWAPAPQAASPAPVVAEKPTAAPQLVTATPAVPAPAAEALVPDVQVVSLAAAAAAPVVEAAAAPVVEVVEVAAEAAPAAVAPAVEVAALSEPAPSSTESPADAVVSFVQAAAESVADSVSESVAAAFGSEEPAASSLPDIEVLAVSDSPSAAAEAPTEVSVAMLAPSDAAAPAVEAPAEPEAAAVAAADE